MIVDIKGYEGLYTLSDSGEVVGSKCNKPIKQYLDKHGYVYVCLYKNCIAKKIKLHRLLALHFIDNPHNKPQINHVNGIKNDNRLCNLEWCTASENQLHAFKTGLQKIKGMKKVAQYTVDGTLIKIWNSISEASRNGFRAGDICSCCQHKKRHRTHGGYKWEYA